MKKSELTAIQWIIGTTLFVVFLAIEEVVAHGDRFPFPHKILLGLSLIAMVLMLIGAGTLGAYLFRRFKNKARVTAVTRGEVNELKKTGESA